MWFKGVADEEGLKTAIEQKFSDTSQDIKGSGE